MAPRTLAGGQLLVVPKRERSGPGAPVRGNPPISATRSGAHGGGRLGRPIWWQAPCETVVFVRLALALLNAFVPVGSGFSSLIRVRNEPGAWRIHCPRSHREAELAAPCLIGGLSQVVESGDGSN